MGMDFKQAFDPFRALRHGWASLQKEPAAVIVAGLLMVVLDSCQGGGGNNLPSDLGNGGGMDGTMAAVLGAVALVGCCIGVAVLLAKSFVEPGAYRIGERLTIDGTSGLDPLFSGKDVWLSVLGYNILKALIGAGVFIVTALPGGAVIGLAILQADGGDPNPALLIIGGLLIFLICVPTLIYIMLGLQLGNIVVALDRLTTMEALDRSWSLAKGNRIQLFIFNFVNGLVIFTGLLLCCVGMIPARGVVLCATSNAYLLHTRDDYEDFELVKELGAF